MKTVPISMAILALSLLTLSGVKAQYATYGTIGGDYTQNFSSLSNALTQPATTAGVFGFGPSSTISASGLSGWYGDDVSKSVYTNFYSSTGASNTTGGFYVFGSNSTSTNGALALITTSATGNELFGVGLQNTTGYTLTSFNISYDAAVFHWGTSTNSKTLDFGYVFGGATLPTINSSAIIAASTGGGSYTHDSALDFTTNSTAGVTQAVNGFSSGNYAPESDTITGVNWTNNGVLWLVWSIGTNTAQSPGLGIDNLSVTAIPEPSSYALFISGGVLIAGFLFRRKKA